MRGVDFDFYYGSEDNYMWQYLEEICEELRGEKLFTGEMSTDCCVQAARRFLRLHRVWMYDVLQVYRRRSGRECSASDSDIEVREFARLQPALEKPVDLNAIAFTSEQAAKWAFEAMKFQELITLDTYQTFKRNFDEWKKIGLNPSSREGDIKRKFESPFLTAGILRLNIDFYLLPSPTGRSRMGLRIEDKKRIYRHVLFERSAP